MTPLRLLLPLVFLIFHTFGATAQQNPETSPNPAPDFVKLMSAKNLSFRASQALLHASFAKHLYGANGPATVSDLAGRNVAYDPSSGTRFTPGAMLYHLASPLEVARKSGTPTAALLVEIIEMRLIWLAGETDRAYERATQIIDAQTASGAFFKSDAEITSLLADAAVLAYRAGDMTKAKGYFARAMTCGLQDCPADLIFQWFGPQRKYVDEPEQDQPAKLNVAVQVAETLFGKNTNLHDQIQSEADLMGPAVRQHYATFLGKALDTSDATQLTIPERRQMRQLAERAVETLGFAGNFMGNYSVGGYFRRNIGGDYPDALSELNEIGYLELGSYETGMLTGYLPLVIQLLRHSERRGDAVMAELMRIRVLLSNGQRARGLAQLQTLAKRARAQGFSESELFSVSMDIWAVALLLGRIDVAVGVWQQTALCRETACLDDLTVSFVEGSTDLPRMQQPDGWRALLLAAADPFVRQNFPGNRLMLADLYDTGQSQKRPMDAARNSLISLSFAESAQDIAAPTLVKHATKTMDTLVYAGQYSQALDVGDRIATRLQEAGQSAALSGRFFQTRGRAAFRVDDPRAYDFYAAAVAQGGNSELALDLLDTPFLDLLDALPSRLTSAGIRARVLYRQGKYTSAADELRAHRRRIEAQLGAWFGTYFREQATQLQESGNAAAAQRALEQAQAAENGTDIPADHPAAYGTYWDLKALAHQEAYYRTAAGDTAGATELMQLGNNPSWFGVEWRPLSDVPDPNDLAFYAEQTSSWGGYAQIRDIIDFRDDGNYQAAAVYLKGFRWVAVGAEHNGTYEDAQTLWQMAFTFARAGDTEIAFDLMNRAARIAATLSFAGAGGPGGGTLQLLERDRWRYLLFVDIAWAAISGHPPEDMLVVSRY